MATPPDFVAGQVLTAAQMNAIGLWLVKSQTIGSAVSSVTVTGAFSADYDNYLITINNGAGSAATDITLKFGSVTTGYAWSIIGNEYTATPAGTGSASDTTIRYNGFINTTTGYTTKIEVNSPFLSKQTSTRSTFVTVSGGYSTTGLLNTSDSYTSFIIAPTSGTLTGGTIRVYGYNI
jgi:hypothetical protein